MATPSGQTLFFFGPGSKIELLVDVRVQYNSLDRSGTKAGTTTRTGVRGRGSGVGGRGSGVGGRGSAVGGRGSGVGGRGSGVGGRGSGVGGWGVGGRGSGGRGSGVGGRGSGSGSRCRVQQGRVLYSTSTYRRGRPVHTYGRLIVGTGTPVYLLYLRPTLPGLPFYRCIIVGVGTIPT